VPPPLRSDPQQYGSSDDVDSSTLTPEEEAAVVDQMNLVNEEKLQALRHPGPTWREWFFFDASRWWVGLMLFIGDSWIIAIWIGYGSLLGLVGSMALAAYAEYLLWQYLWHRPEHHLSRSTGGFKRTWYRPVPFGRWTPEGEAFRAGDLAAPQGAPDPREFL
jgi:hypothetical protein